MAVRVDLTREYITEALTKMIDSQKRLAKQQLNPLMTEIINKDILTLQTAINTLQDVK